MASQFRWIADPLYGAFELDRFAYDLSHLPVVQRLRHVRLSNIPSIQIPGIANGSRFEHSIGVAHLATILADSLQLSTRERLTLLAAAMLHDAGITPFGHLMEEAFRYADVEFDHEARIEQVYKGAETGGQYAQLFRGRIRGLHALLETKDWVNAGVTAEGVAELTSGKGSLGQLLAGSVDIDNIDNVCRVAMYVGLPFERELPVTLTKSFRVHEGRPALEESGIDPLERWLDLRRRLYSVLMTNPVDFSSKAMLTDAMVSAISGEATGTHIAPEDWKLTDDELLARLRLGQGTQKIVEGFELGEVYDLLYLGWIALQPDSDSLRSFAQKRSLRASIANELAIQERDLALYFIKDKRERQIKDLPIISRGKFIETRTFGRGSNMVLVGVAYAKHGGSSSWRGRIETVLRGLTGVSDVSYCDPEDYIREAFNLADIPEPRQLELL